MNTAVKQNLYFDSTCVHVSVRLLSIKVLQRFQHMCLGQCSVVHAQPRNTEESPFKFITSA